MKKRIKSFYTVFLAILVIVLCITTKREVSAASKAECTTELTISRGKQDEYSGIYVYNKKNGATYTYESSDKSIVKVDKEGVPTGLKTGKVKVTVYQTYQGKKTKVGVCKITVKKASIAKWYQTNGLELQFNDALETETSYGDYSFENLNYWDIIEYRNYDATYTYESSDSNVVKVKKDGAVTYVGDPGKSATITIKETYNKDTITVGQITVKISTPYVDLDELTVSLNSKFYPGSYVYGTAYYYLIVSDKEDINEIDLDDIAEVTESSEDASSEDVLLWDLDEGEWTGALIANSEGTRYLHFFCGSEPRMDRYIATIKTTVAYMKATDVSWDSYYAEDETVKMYVSDDEYSEYCLYYYVEPYGTSDIPEVTVSDESIAIAEVEAYDSDYGRVVFAVKKRGTVDVTLTVGDISIHKKVKFIFN